MSVIHPTAIVPETVSLGANVEIGPFCVLSPHTRLGDGVRLISHVVTYGLVDIGAETQVWPFAVLGGTPQISNYADGETRLVIGRRNMIREHVTLHRGSSRQDGLTQIGDDGLFMGQSHVAHDCVVGDRVVMAQGATLGGHVDLGDGAYVGGHAAVHQFCRVGQAAFIGGLAAVTKDVAPFALANGNPATIMAPNLRGLQRRGVPKDRIRALKSAFDEIFAGEGVLEERIDRLLARADLSDEANVFAQFLSDNRKRPLMTMQMPGAGQGSAHR